MKAILDVNLIEQLIANEIRYVLKFRETVSKTAPLPFPDYLEKLEVQLAAIRGYNGASNDGIE